MTEVERDELGVEEETEDSTFSVNRVLIENPEGAITLKNLAKETQEDEDLSVAVEDVKIGKLSTHLKKTAYG